MAEGDLINYANQYEYNGILLGLSSPYIMSDIEGLLSMPELMENDVQRQDAVGVWANPAYPGARVIEFDVTGSFASSDLAEAAVRDLRMAFRPEPGTFRKFVFQRPGELAMWCWAQPRRRSFTADYDLNHGLLTGSVSLFCPDPRIYSATVTEPTLSIASPNTSASLTIENTGNYRAPFVVEIVGPATNPILTNNTLGRAIRTTTVLTGAQTMEIDSRQRTIKINDVDSYNVLRNDNQWWDLEPGDNSVTLSRTNTGAIATADFTYRETWV